MKSKKITSLSRWSRAGGARRGRRAHCLILYILLETERIRRRARWLRRCQWPGRVRGRPVPGGPFSPPLAPKAGYKDGLTRAAPVPARLSFG